MSAKSGEREIWESTIEGRISVEVSNKQGRPQKISIVGKGSRMRVLSEERVLIEESVRHEQHNPFRNGMMVQVGGPVPVVEEGEAAPSTEQALLDDDLGALFMLTGEDFENAVRSLSETNVRRLKGMVVEKDAARSQSEFLDEHIQEQWPIGADTPSNAEARGDRAVTV